MVSLHKQPLSRRTMFKGGAAGASAFAFPTFFSSSRARAQETLSFWQFYAPGGQVATQGSWFEEMVNAWNEQNDVKVELNYVPVQDYLGGATLQTAFASGEGPDIFIISPGDFLRYYNGGVLADLTPYMDQAAIDDFYPDVLASRMVDGKVYGLPMEVEPLAMYYDPAAWEDAGLSDADIPQTWEQLLAVAEQLTTGDRFGVLFEQSPGYYQNFTWYPFMWMGGAEIVHEDGVTSGLRDEGAVQALKFWQDTISAEVAPRESLGTGGGDAAANLATGYCAMQQTGIWALAALRENAPDFEFGLSSCPLRRTAPTRPTSAVGPSSPTPRAGTPKRRHSSASGRSARWRRTRSSASSIGARRPRATCRRASRSSRTKRRKRPTRKGT